MRPIFLKSLFYFHLTCKCRNKGKNNKIFYRGAFPKGISFYFSGNNNKIFFGENSRILNSKVVVRGNNHTLVIEKDCVIKDSSFDFKDNDCCISIGDNTTSEGINIMVNENGPTIKIGRDCMFSYGISIRSGDGHSIIDLQTRMRINPVRDIVIEDHVWVGAYSNILKGSIIRSDSIIGLSSVVAGEVKSNTIVAGIPAKELKNGITWTRERHAIDQPVSENLLWEETVKAYRGSAVVP